MTEHGRQAMLLSGENAQFSDFDSMQENCALVVKSYSTLPGRSSSPQRYHTLARHVNPGALGHFTSQGFRGT